MTDEIEITQEMIDAALNVLWTSDAGAVDEVYYDIMERVLRAALGTRRAPVAIKFIGDLEKKD